MNEVTQTELARMLDVDRTTIHAWQNKGLPYISHGKGKPNTYRTGVAIHWMVGREKLQELVDNKKIDKSQMTTTRCILLGRLLAHIESPATSEDFDIMVDMCGDVSREQVLMDIGYCARLMEQYCQGGPRFHKNLLN